MSDPKPVEDLKERTPSGVQLLAPLDPRKLIEEARDHRSAIGRARDGLTGDGSCAVCEDAVYPCLPARLCDALERALEEMDEADKAAVAFQRARLTAEAEVEHFRAVAGQAIDQVEALRAKLALLGEVVEAARVTLATIDQTEIEDEMPGIGAAIRDALARVDDK